MFTVLKSKANTKFYDLPLAGDTALQSVNQECIKRFVFVDATQGNISDLQIFYLQT